MLTVMPGEASVWHWWNFFFSFIFLFLLILLSLNASQACGMDNCDMVAHAIRRYCVQNAMHVWWGDSVHQPHPHLLITFQNISTDCHFYSVPSRCLLYFAKSRTNIPYPDIFSMFTFGTSTPNFQIRRFSEWCLNAFHCVHLTCYFKERSNSVHCSIPSKTEMNP